MADTYTKKLNLNKPEVNASRNAWGGKWNSNADLLDTAVGAAQDAIQPGRSAGYFSFLNNAQCSFGKREGNKVFINGAFYKIPDTNVIFQNTGLTAGTTQYAYVYMKDAATAGDPPVMTGEWSTAVPVADATYGHKVKNGDPTRTLVGMAFMGSGTPGTFTADNVLSHLTRQDRIFTLTETLDNNGSGAETQMGALTRNFVAWPDSLVEAEAFGRINNSTDGATNNFTVRLQVPGGGSGAYNFVQGGPLSWGTLASKWSGFMKNAGQFFAAVYGYVNFGNGVCYATVTVRTKG